MVIYKTLSMQVMHGSWEYISRIGSKDIFFAEKVLSVMPVSNAIADAWALMKPCFYGSTNWNPFQRFIG
jgi:hypothetical protein